MFTCGPTAVGNLRFAPHPITLPTPLRFASAPFFSEEEAAKKQADRDKKIQQREALDAQVQTQKLLKKQQQEQEEKIAKQVIPICTCCGSHLNLWF